MSQKKNKKRHSQSSVNAKKRAVEEEIADRKDRDRKRMKPLARNLMLGDLVFLAISQILYDQQIVSTAISNLMTVVGAALFLFALYIQFGGNNRPRL